MLTMLSEEAYAQLTRLIDERIAARVEQAARQASPVSPWLTVRDAAAYMGTSPGAVYKRIDRKQLRAHRPEGSRILLRRDEIDELLDRSDTGSYDLTTSNSGPARLAPPGP